MKNLITLLLLGIGLSVNAQLTSVTEGGNTGQRLSVSNAANHGDIGDKAVDLSYSGVTSTTLGATGVYSTAMGYQTTASGSVSTAMGYITTASGTLSTASGDYSTASGYASTAMGYGTIASGTISTAMGQNTTASGTNSTAMGMYTTASDYASTAIGHYNSSGSTATSADSFSTSAPAFVVGNGTDDSNRSDAFKVMFNGDAYVSNSLYLGGTQITSTAAELNLLSGVTALGTGILEPVTENGNTGVRLSSSDAANHGDIGSNAVDLSYSDSSSSTRGATGQYSVAMGYYTTASGPASTAMGYESTASGFASIAIGKGTASSSYSIATGNDTTASGNTSTAMGQGSTASGAISTAIGIYPTASGTGSTAMGMYTTASDFASTVIGHYNSSGSSTTNSASTFNTANTAFVIGNGADESNRSDAFKVMFNGDAYVSNSLYLGGTEIISTAAELNLLSGVTSLGTGILESVTEGSNTGVRLSSSDAANHGDIGDYAVDLSYSDSASTIFGATGQYSVTMGLKATANGNVSTAMGSVTTASGYVSTAMGINTTASGVFSTATGAGTTASGNVSTAMGEGTEASDYASTVIGQFNSSGSTATSADSFSTSAPAFVIGNGTASSSRSDAFKVMFNGDATVSNDLTVNGDVTVSSDERLKANIVSLGATLSKLLNIDGKTYTVKKNGVQKIGVLAQDIQEVFPELVSEDNEGMLSVNYQGLIPVLINALKEQEQKFQAQEERLKTLERILYKE